MSKWGRGWEVGINREIWSQRRALQRAQEILRYDHREGKHDEEKHPSCPICHPEQEVF